MKKHAFSLIELVITLAILGLMLSLLLAGIHRVRTSALKLSCSNHLRQIGLALQSHHDTQGHFPSGIRLSDRIMPIMHFAGWQVHLLPHIEQVALHERARVDYERDPLMLHPPGHGAMSRTVATFVCPADARIQSSQYVASNRLTVGFTSYLGVCGTNCFEPDGILHADSQVTVTMVRDGLSQTLIVGERPPDTSLERGWWYAGIGQKKTGSTEMILGAEEPCREKACPMIVYRFSPGSFEQICDRYHFWSPHSGGAHFTFADGSVRFLHYSSASILTALATRAGGETPAAER
jgi:prepilin-type N-terminal cleavage/methylation domain-containing protein/prepilin-type processing-associated H-X9-DG protein